MKIKATIKQRRRIWKYIAAISAFQEAEEVVAHIATQVGDGFGNQNLVNGLWTGAISSYCRPFTHNNNVGPIDVDLVPLNKRKLHDALWKMRNKFCGHTDHEAVLDTGAPLFNVAIERVGDKLAAHCPGARPAVVVSPDILTLTTKMKDICHFKWLELLKELVPVKSIPPRKFTIDLSDGSEYLFIQES